VVSRELLCRGRTEATRQRPQDSTLIHLPRLPSLASFLKPIRSGFCSAFGDAGLESARSNALVTPRRSPRWTASSSFNGGGALAPSVPTTLAARGPWRLSGTADIRNGRDVLLLELDGNGVEARTTSYRVGCFQGDLERMRAGL